MIDVMYECEPGGKLSKPKELKGVKPLFSYKWGGITSCPVFIAGDDIWIKHCDWCSLTLYGRKNTKYRQAFVYSDGFTAPTIKGTAYIRITDAIRCQRGCRSRCLSAMWENYDDSRYCMDDMRMFNDVTVEVWRRYDDKL